VKANYYGMVIVHILGRVHVFEGIVFDQYFSLVVYLPFAISRTLVDEDV